ncbi:transporter substrate-binding domain-containing protein [Bowmanella denitrificans]|uniref:transporter substrate-binding domain-containing protein n=1 Tax=Bowmanella denitrificans TaxID=366582 RepID=UPI000C9CA7C3|nr:transporter substrate-binding domain-containing protein [Bowmanella denitrificans]
MRQHLFFRACLGMLLTWPVNVLADDLPVIHWGAAHFPPFWQVEDNQPPKGIFAEVQQLVLDQLSDYQHQFDHSNFNRLLLEMQQGKPLCLFGLTKTPERQTYLMFSEPFLPLPAYGAIFKQSEKHKLEPFLLPDGRLSLRSLLNSQNLLLGHIGGRSLGPDIDALLVDGRGRPRPTLVPFMNTQSYQPMMGMLLKGRLDIILGNAIEARYYSAKYDSEDLLSFLPFEESPPHFSAHFACTTGAWGQQIIANINRIVTNNALILAGVERMAAHMLSDNRRAYLQQADTFSQLSPGRPQGAM